MRKFLFILVACISLAANAQSEASAVLAEQSDVEVAAATAVAQQARPAFGYLSYDSVFRSMPDYSVACRQLEELKVKYDAEAKRVEEEFNKKYEEFLEGQKDFPPTILQKRQSELQELLDKNILFKEDSKRLLAEAERELFAPLHAKLSAALKTIGEERGYQFVVSTDNHACPFVNPAMGENVGPLVADMLK